MAPSDPCEQWQNIELTKQARAVLASENAQKSFRVGLQAWAEGANHKAWDWLERANRQAPNNAHVMFALAMARYAIKDIEGSYEILKNILNKNDFYEGWVFLITISQAQSAIPQAMQALTHLLSTFGHTDELSSLSTTFCEKNNLAGWCSLSGNGQLHWGGEVSCAQPIIWLDGQKHAPIQKQKGVFCPKGWREAEILHVTFSNNKPLLGGRFNVQKIVSYEGLVSSEEDCLKGWVWHPHDAETMPVLSVCTYDKKAVLFKLRAKEEKNKTVLQKPFARYRQFTIPAHKLPEGLVHVLGPDGRDVPGSPLAVSQRAHGAALLAACVGNAPSANRQQPKRAAVTPFFPIPYLPHIPLRPDISGQQADLAIIIPVYGHYDSTMACLASVYKTLKGQKISVVIVNDASPDKKLTVDVEKFCKKAGFKHCLHTQNRGFPAAVNTGLRAVPQCDVILLNSDTLVPEGWWQALRKVAYAVHTTCTVTPLSNNASILSYPSETRLNAMPSEVDVPSMMLAAQAANKDESADIPTGNGFCLYIRHDCLQQTGYFREDVFAQGYGEETDFCLRAHALGWKHKAALGVYVAHQGGFSFGEKRLALMERNEDVLEQLHPGYHDAVAQWIQKEPLWEAKRRLDIVRFRAGAMHEVPHAKMILLVTHQHGGGVEQVVQRRVAYYKKKIRKDLDFTST